MGNDSMAGIQEQISMEEYLTRRKEQRSKAFLEEYHRELKGSEVDTAVELVHMYM
jgi:hypothetical protein